MPSRTNLLKLLLVGASCAVIAACSDASVSSPGEENQIPAPPPPGGGGGGGNQQVDLVPSGGCPSGTSTTTQTIGSVDVSACRVTGNVLSDLSLTSDGAYFLSGPVFVGQDVGADASGGAPATITIPAGATIVGETGNDYLVISRGSQIDAQGSASAPITFTSAADLVATETGNPRSFTNTSRGEWGGLIINGRAPINACIDGTATGGTVDCQKSGEGSSGLFGGGTPTDNSGTLRYALVKYAGFRVNNADELNGIAFQGVGSGTTLEYLQVHNNEDDGIEFFGGTANARYLVLTGIADDNLDYTDGWTGAAQFIVVQQAADDGDQGFEFDNNGDENDALPRSNPTISNFTLVGQRTSSASDLGMLLREGTAGTLANGVVVDFNEACLDIDQDATFDQAIAGDLSLQSTLFDCVAPFVDEAGDPASDTPSAFFAKDPNNIVTTNTLSSGYFPGPAETAVTPVDPTTLSPFFTSANYIGAFSPSETPASNWAAGWSFGLFESAQGCPAGTTESSEVINGQSVCQLTGTVNSDVTLRNGPLYELVGPVFIGADGGAEPSGIASASLTIDPGVTVFGSSGGDYIVVSRGSQIFSNGTAAAPVIMTSRQDVEGTATNTSRGQWGGLVINGRAPINACIDGTATGGTADCEKSGEGSSGLFGGGIADDDSGSLSYTRVQYAGFRVNNQDELNGIAFQGTGSGTDVNFVQVHNNEDDGIEFFGGATNAKYLVLTGIADDSLDYTDGWVGNVQYVIVQQAGDDGDQGFEFDNNGDENDALPRSNPTIANFTLIGQRASSASDLGMLLREGTAGTLVNGIVVDFNESCLDIDQDATFDQAIAGDLSLQSTFFDCVTSFVDEAGDPASDTPSAFFAKDPNNTEGTTTLSGFSFITDMTANTAKGVVPGAAEQAVTAVDPSTLDPFFDSVSYIGAVEDANDTWYQGWTLTQQ